jgi:hypothetical protein
LTVETVSGSTLSTSIASQATSPLRRGRRLDQKLKRTWFLKPKFPYEATFRTLHVSDAEKNPNEADHALFVWFVSKQETDNVFR